MGRITDTILYFEHCGETNTLELLKWIALKIGELKLNKVVIASETGRSALKALEILGTDVEIIVVTHYPATTWGPRGTIPIGLQREEYEDTRRKLEAAKVKIVQGTRPFVPPSRNLNWDSSPEALVGKTLELMGAGTKIAVEVAIMATDTGVLKEGERVCVSRNFQNTNRMNGAEILRIIPHWMDESTC